MAQLGIILHAACNAWGNAIITFFTPFDLAPCDKKSRSEHQTLFPLFGEGSGHETNAHQRVVLFPDRIFRAHSGEKWSGHETNQRGHS